MALNSKPSAFSIFFSMPEMDDVVASNSVSTSSTCTAKRLSEKRLRKPVGDPWNDLGWHSQELKRKRVIIYNENRN